MALNQEQINELVKEYNAFMASEGRDPKTEDEVLEDLQAYAKDFTDYEDFDEIPFEELLDFIG
ncbi:hypothetical protein ACXM1Q_000425 [Streptococcus sp. 10F2]